MAEYIDKEAFIAHEKRQMHEIHDLGILCGAQGCLNDLKKFPAADVRENVKGEWEQVEDHDWAGKGKTVCSKCHYGYSWRMYFEVELFKYCPNCGAQMEMQDG